MKKKVIIIVIVAAVLAIGGITAAVMLSGGSSVSVSASDMLQLADRYLKELNYEQAIVEFQKVLTIDPKNVEAYLGIADAYVALGDTKKAVEILKQAQNNIGTAENADNAQRIENKLEEVNKLTEQVQSTTTTETEPITTTTAATTTTETTAQQETTTPATETTPETTTTAATPATETTTTTVETTTTTAVTTTTAETTTTTAATTTTEATTTVAPISIPMTIPVYSVDDLTFTGTPKTPDQLVDFTLNTTYCPDDLSALFNNIGHPEFKKLFSVARALNGIISVSGIMYLMDWPEYLNLVQAKIRMPGRYFDSSYFESFYSCCLNTLTDDYINSLFSGSDMNVVIINGGLWLSGGGIGGDPTLVHTEYRVSKQNDVEIEIEQVNYCSKDWSVTFDPLKKDQYDIRIETVKFSLTSNGWRVSEVYFP